MRILAHKSRHLGVGKRALFRRGVLGIEGTLRAIYQCEEGHDSSEDSFFYEGDLHMEIWRRTGHGD